MSYAQRGDRPHTSAEQDRVMLRVWTAYRCMLLGTATREEWSDLADGLNIVESLCAINKLDGAKVMPIVITAQAGMVAAMRCDPEPMRMDADQLEALATVCDLYDVALYRFSASTLERARIFFIGQLVAQKVRPGESRVEVMA